MVFLRGANLSGLIYLAPVVAWSAILLGAGLAWIWIRCQCSRTFWSRSTQGSFLLTTMVGNTGYLGYPIVLSLVGPQYFVWALFYDLLGTTLAAYGLGIGIAVRFGTMSGNGWHFFQQLLKNPPLWSFLLGMSLRKAWLPSEVSQILQILAWLMVALSLLLLGMRLGQLSSWQSLPQASLSLGIKMLLIPLAIGAGLSLIGVEGPVRLALVLQAAMPPAFATLVLSEVYNLDKDFTVTALAAGSIGLLMTLPIWLWLFGI